MVLDLNLPSVDGLDVPQRITSGPSTRTTPVVILTSLRERDITNTYDPGVHRRIVQPGNFHQFTEAVFTVRLYWLLLNQSRPVGDKQESRPMHCPMIWMTVPHVR
jgi:two-component system, response regulator